MDKLKYDHVVDLENEILDLNSVASKINNTKGTKLIKLPKKFHKQIEFSDLVKKIRFQEMDVYHTKDLSMKDNGKSYYLIIK
jgi:hypothetical protein